MPKILRKAPRPKRKQRIVAIDTETTGVDHAHGAAPYLVTICENGENIWWQWEVDPLTRKVLVDKGDLKEIQDVILGADVLVGQNIRFDYRALQTVFGGKLQWDWDKVDDTLISGHLLASNQPHDLTSMVLVYLHVNIQPLEDAMEAAVKEAKSYCKREHPDWRLAKAGLPEMPSAKEKTWKFDSWLPYALWKECRKPSWKTVTADYANGDSSTTLALRNRHRELLEKRNLVRIYQEQLKLLPVVAAMESRGVTLNGNRLKQLRTQYEKDSQKAERTCLAIAAKMGCELTLPKSGNNKSLQSFVYGEPCQKCEGVGYVSVGDAKASCPVCVGLGTTGGLNLRPLNFTEGGKPSLDKATLEHWEATLPADSQALKFVQALRGKRKRDTSVNYLDGYQRFWLPVGKGWFILHPSLNQTGTDTLRFSSNNPNSQNISKGELDGHSLRYCFGPLPGREWWSMDYQNLELRIPSYEAGEKDAIWVFEHPNDPPYYGSYHFLVCELLHPKLFKEHGKGFKDQFKSSWYQWVKNGNFCVPMSSEALTSEGWKSYSEIKVGDLVLGYKTGKLKWTPVLAKHKTRGRVIRLENNHFTADSTENHRWIGKKRVGGRNSRRVVSGEFQTKDINPEVILRLSAPVEDKGRLPITDVEAAIIGFVYGDGSIESSPFVGAPSQSRGKKTKFRVRIFQSKPEGVKFVDEMLATWGRKVKRSVRPNGLVVWELLPGAGRSLWKRAGLSLVKKTGDMVSFVLKLGTSARKAYLDAVFAAEGTRDRMGHKIYSQNVGSFAESIKLAVFMTGNFPTVCNAAITELSRSQCINIRASKPYVTGQRLKREDRGVQDVWCITTELGSWVMRQDKHIMLTGNSVIYGAQEAKADATYHVPGAYGKIRKRFPKIAALSDKQVAQANKIGYVETMPDKFVDPARGYPILCSRSHWGSVSPTVPLNYHVQSTAMWLTREAMIRCHGYLSTLPDHHLTLQVHDELVFDLPKGNNQKIIDKLRQLMEKGGEGIGVPTPVSAEKHSENWSKHD